MRKRILLVLLALVCAMPCGIFVSSEEAAVSRIEFYKDSEFTQAVNAEDIAAGDTVCYRSVVAEGEVLAKLMLAGVDSATDTSFVAKAGFDFRTSYVTAGDFDQNGSFNITDAIGIVRSLAGWETEGVSVPAADTDCDGVLSSLDAIALTKYIVGHGYPFDPYAPPAEVEVISANELVDMKISELAPVTSVTKESLDSVLKDIANLSEHQRKQLDNADLLKDAIGVLAEKSEEDLTVSVMSFNVRYLELEADRLERVCRLIDMEDPDIIALQEGTPPMMEAIRAAHSDEYGILGHGHLGTEDVDGNEGNQVMYKKDKFNLLDSGTFWLSDSPYEYSVLPSTFLAQVMTYQILERKSDGAIFVHSNTHLDHVYVQSRLEQIEYFLEYTHEAFDGYCPIILTGDFNAREGSREFKEIVRAGYEASNAYGEDKRTFNGYGSSSKSVIDFCFANQVTPIISYKVCSEKLDGEWISDHNAIMTEVIIYSPEK